MTLLLQLGQELDWQALELRRSDLEMEGPAGDLEAIRDSQRRVIATADKIQRELLASVRFDPLRLVGVGGPIGATLDSVSELLVAIDAVRQNALTRANELPSSVRSLQGLLQGFCNDGAPVAA
ncbi:MAG TPA: hypothetical protein VG206_00795 [Terriglobia bacterium]|nr:hypothetical protein [Terriglobia bacterium]